MARMRYGFAFLGMLSFHERRDTSVVLTYCRETLLAWMVDWAAEVVQTIKAHRDSMSASIRQAVSEAELLWRYGEKR